jgi:uncharacterized protein
MKLTLIKLPESYSILRMNAGDDVPAWALKSFLSITRTDDELSIVTSTPVPECGYPLSTGWSGFKLQGPFNFNLTGVLISVLDPLADAGIGIFAISTFDTDYVLVKTENAQLATEALTHAQHTILSKDKQ